MEKFTKGPWLVDDSHCKTSINTTEKHICMVNFSKRGKESDVDEIEHIANAHLIAAAPDLYEALKPFARYACGCEECHNCIALSALKKARGE